MAFRHLQKLLYGGLLLGGGSAVTVYGLYIYDDLSKNTTIGRISAADKLNERSTTHLLTRTEQLKRLKDTPEFDILVVGGGATGAGVALDAISRGYKTALVEMDDFSSGTSSRSTKLIHGGVRYLQKAILGFDYEQYRMVKEALRERANLLDIAPHLSNPLPIMLPVYKWWQVPYYYVGIKMYDLVAGSKCVRPSYYLTKTRALELFPMLKKDELVGALVYYDGQHNDARMNLAIALTATRLGATIANHCEVTRLLKKEDENGKQIICGVHVKDCLTGDEWDIKSKCVVNATGPFTDHIRLMEDKSIPKICQPSSGVHVVLPNYYSPQFMGLLDPSTSDGRVIFFLPWEKVTLAGTTDKPCEVTHHPVPTEQEIQFILKEVRDYLNQDVRVRRGDVLSAWSGIRPLVSDPNAKDTQSIARNHVIHVSDGNLVTIAGGKWTTYRSMAQETVDTAISVCSLHNKGPSQTLGLLLEGAHNYTTSMYIRLVQDFGMDYEVAQHLANTYGDRAFSVAKLANLTGKRWPLVGKKLHDEYPYIEAEIKYSIREYACTAVDVIARRLRLAFVNVQAAEEALPRIVELMGNELNWNAQKKQEQYDTALYFLNHEMGRKISDDAALDVPIDLTKDEINLHVSHFKQMDSGNKGFITVNDLRLLFKKRGEKIPEDQLHEMLSEVDLNKNGEIDLGEFLQLMSAIKTGAITHSRLAKAAAMFDDKMSVLSVNRSGGGL